MRRSTLEVFQAIDVFTPTKSAMAAYVERALLSNSLQAAIETPGKQIVIYGHSGSGKSTLLANTLGNRPRIITRCTSTLSFDQMLLNAFDELGPFFESEATRKRSQGHLREISASYALMAAKINHSHSDEVSEKSVRVVPPQLTPQSLANFLGSAGYCWILEDFHKSNDAAKSDLAQVMKLFMDMAGTYPNLRIICLGAVDTARQVVQYDSDMHHRVSEINVPLMNRDEIEAIIDKGTSLLNIVIPKEIRNQIAVYSAGLPAVCHQLCLNICRSMKVSQTVRVKRFTTPDNLRDAVHQHILEASDTLKSRFERALRRKRERKYDNAAIILGALAELDDEGATFAQILSQIHSTVEGYPSGNLKNYITKLIDVESGQLIEFLSNSNKYRFRDPLARAYALSIFHKREDISVMPSRESIQPLFYEVLKSLEELIPRWEMLRDTGMQVGENARS